MTNIKTRKQHEDIINFFKPSDYSKEVLICHNLHRAAVLKYRTQQEKRESVHIDFESSLQGKTHDTSNKDATESTNYEKEYNEYSMLLMHYEDGYLFLNGKGNVNKNLYTLSQGYNDRFVTDILKKSC